MMMMMMMMMIRAAAGGLCGEGDADAKCDLSASGVGWRDGCIIPSCAVVRRGSADAAA